MKMKRIKALGISVVTFVLLSGPSAGSLRADVIGASVSAQIYTFGVGNIAGWGPTWGVQTQFASPAMVGPGVEFTGVIWEVDGPFETCGVACLFKNFANVTLDITGTGFTIVVTPTGPDISGWPTYTDDWGISMSGLVWQPGPTEITALNLLTDNGLHVTSYTASQPTAGVQWGATRTATGSGGTATFSFVTGIPSAPVPEPAAVFLVGSVLMGLVGWGRKKVSNK